MVLHIVCVCTKDGGWPGQYSLEICTIHYGLASCILGIVVLNDVIDIWIFSGLLLQGFVKDKLQLLYVVEHIVYCFS